MQTERKIIALSQHISSHCTCLCRIGLVGVAAVTAAARVHAALAVLALLLLLLVLPIIHLVSLHYTLQEQISRT